MGAEKMHARCCGSVHGARITVMMLYIGARAHGHTPAISLVQTALRSFQHKL